MSDQVEIFAQRWLEALAADPGRGLAAILEDLAQCAESDREPLTRRALALLFGPRIDFEVAQAVFTLISNGLAPTPESIEPHNEELRGLRSRRARLTQELEDLRRTQTASDAARGQHRVLTVAIERKNERILQLRGALAEMNGVPDGIEP